MHGTKKTSVVQANSKVTFHNITSSFSPVTNYESCLARQHFISNQTYHKLRKTPANKKRICLYDSVGFEYDIVHKFADALYTGLERL